MADNRPDESDVDKQESKSGLKNGEINKGERKSVFIVTDLSRSTLFSTLNSFTPTSLSTCLYYQYEIS